MKRVALIWEFIPETAHLYIFENPSEDTIQMLEGSNNLFFNSDTTNEHMEHLSETLDKMIPTPFPCSLQIDKIYLSGFFS